MSGGRHTWNIWMKAMRRCDDLLLYMYMYNILFLYLLKRKWYYEENGIAVLSFVLHVDVITFYLPHLVDLLFTFCYVILPLPFAHVAPPRTPPRCVVVAGVLFWWILFYILIVIPHFVRCCWRSLIVLILPFAFCLLFGYRRLFYLHAPLPLHFTFLLRYDSLLVGC